MSNNVWPVLPGLDFRVTRSAEWNTTIHQTANGKEYRSTSQVAPRYRYRLQYNGLRKTVNAPSPWGAYSELAVVFQFLSDHNGAFDSFLFGGDPVDGTQRRVRFAEDSLKVTSEGGWFSCELELISVL
jgi:hypothetical protein